MNRNRPQRRMLRRLLVAQLLVVLAGSATLGVVALLVAPPIFHEHIHRAVGPVTDIVAQHLDAALSETMLLALAGGIGAGTIAAAGMSWMLANRIARPIEALSATAHALTEGHLDARAARPAANDELADLTDTFNTMADALEHSERTRRELLADLAHELRTPLATIEAYHEGLGDGVIQPDATTSEVLADATTRLRRLVDDVALVSQAEEGQLRLDRAVVDVNDVIAATVDATRNRAEAAGVVLIHRQGDTPVRASVDPDRLAQVLTNLLTNAIQHADGADTVTIDTAVRNRRVVITVTDTGAGIHPDHLPHVFQRFYRADPARSQTGGSGIGLTISRAIIRNHGGDLTAASLGEGRGATFTITLPTDFPPGV